MSDVRNVLRGHNRGDGRGARGGNGSFGAFDFFVRFWTKWNFRPFIVKSSLYVVVVVVDCEDGNDDDETL